MSPNKSKRGRDDSPEREERKTKKKKSGDEGEEEEKESISKASTSKMKTPSHSSSHKPAELFRKDLISAMKLPDSEPLAPEDYLLIADAWRQEWERGVQVPVNQVSIPTANIREVSEKYKTTGDFKIPKKLLHASKDETYKQGVHELTGMSQLAEQVVRYDLDDLDVCWLRKINEEREEMGEIQIHEWTMERVIEALEAQCHENMEIRKKTEEGLGIEYDEDIVCEICRSPDSEDSNEMVFCDGCDICVHQACYGIQTVPEGSWLCRTCALGIKPSCILCPKTGGAMKSTRSGTKWSHVSCAIWIPEVTIGCVEKMEPITKISQIPASRWALVCVICKERVGACIQCSVKACKTAFHVTCAFGNNLEMKTVLVENEKNADDAVKLKAYCPKHSKKRERNSSESEPDSPRKSVSGSPKKEMTEEEKATLRADRLQMLEDEFYTVVKCSDIATALQLDEDIIDVIFVFWKLKRKTQFNKPLLTPKTEEEDLLEKQQEDSLVARMKMFVHLRQDLERVRNLSYMVSRREKMKRQYYKSRENVFYAALSVLTSKSLNLSPQEVDKVVQQYKDVSSSEFKAGKGKTRLKLDRDHAIFRKKSKGRLGEMESSGKGRYSPNSAIDSDQSSVSSCQSSKHSPPNLSDTKYGHGHRGSLLVESLCQTSDNEFETETPKQKSLSLKSKRLTTKSASPKNEQTESCQADENEFGDKMDDSVAEDKIIDVVSEEPVDILSDDVEEETGKEYVKQKDDKTETVSVTLFSPVEKRKRGRPSKESKERFEAMKAALAAQKTDEKIETVICESKSMTEKEMTVEETDISISSNSGRRSSRRNRNNSSAEPEFDLSIVKTDPDKPLSETVDVESVEDALVQESESKVTVVPAKRTRSGAHENVPLETAPSPRTRHRSEGVLRYDCTSSKTEKIDCIEKEHKDRFSPAKETRSVVAQMTEQEQEEILKSVRSAKNVSEHLRTELNSYFKNNKLAVSDKLKHRVQNRLLKGRRKHLSNGILDKSQTKLESFFKPVNNTECKSPKQIETRSSRNSSPVLKVDLSRVLNELSPTRDRLSGDVNNLVDSVLSPRYRISRGTGNTPEHKKSPHPVDRMSDSPDSRSVRRKIDSSFISSVKEKKHEQEIRVTRSSRETTPESTGSVRSIGSYRGCDLTNSNSVKSGSVTPTSLGKCSEDLDLENMCDDVVQRRRTRSQIIPDEISKERSLSPKNSLRSHIRSFVT